MILTRMLRIWAQCKEHRNKKTFLIFEKINLKIQEKRIHFIVQHSRHRKDNKSSDTKIYPPEENKKIGKSRIHKHETLKHFAKNGQKTFKTAFMKKFQLFFQKLKAEK